MFAVENNTRNEKGIHINLRSNAALHRTPRTEF